MFKFLPGFQVLIISNPSQSPSIIAKSVYYQQLDIRQSSLKWPCTVKMVTISNVCCNKPLFFQDGRHPKVAPCECAWPCVNATLYLNGHYKRGNYIQSTVIHFSLDCLQGFQGVWTAQRRAFKMVDTPRWHPASVRCHV